MAAFRYQLIALDLDGTVLDARGRISEATRLAVAKARQTGIHVVVATGRGLVESEEALEVLGLNGPAVVAGGAMIADHPTRRTLHRRTMAADLAVELAEFMNASGHVALLLKDRAAADLDYLVVGEGPLDPATDWWFERMPVRVSRVRRPEDDPHPDETVRVGVVAPRDAMRELGQSIVRAFGSRAFVHHFPAVTTAASQHKPGQSQGRPLPPEPTELLEVFSPETNKWSALETLAGMLGIDAARIAAIGDAMNDAAMIRHAALGIAMGNAEEPLKQIAGRITLPQSQDGVAFAIERMLAGEW